MKYIVSTVLVLTSGLHISALHCNSIILSGIFLISYATVYDNKHCTIYEK